MTSVGASEQAATDGGGPGSSAKTSAAGHAPTTRQGAPGVRETRGTVGSAGMWAFLATDAMGFASLFIAYAVLRVRAPAWPDPRGWLPLPPAALMTATLMGCSLTVALAVRARRDAVTRGWLFVTIVLGAAFLSSVAVEYRRLWNGGAGVGFSRDLVASTFYALTGYHALHVLAGVVLLALIVARRRVPPKVVAVVALYWHFVDIAWMPIFTFVYLLPAS